MESNTFSGRLEAYENSVAVSNIAGIGLVGLISIVAVGTLDASPVLLRRIYFFVLGFSFLIVAFCRLHSELQIARIKHMFDTEDIEPHDNVDPQEIAIWQRHYFHVALCVFSVSLPGSVFLLGLWVPVFDLPMHWLVVIMALFSIAPFVGLPFAHRTQRIANEATPLEPTREIDTEMSNENGRAQGRDCRRQLEIYKDVARRINVIGVAFVAQVTCVGANALACVPVLFLAILFTVMVFGSVFLGLYRLMIFFSTQRIRRDIDAGIIKLEDPPQVDHIVDNRLLDSRVFGLSAIFPPLVLWIGTAVALFQVRYPYSIVLPSLLFLIWGFAFLRSLWSPRPY